MQLRQILNLKLSFELAKFEGINYDLFKLSTILYDSLPAKQQKLIHAELLEADSNAEVIDICVNHCNVFIGGIQNGWRH